MTWKDKLKTLTSKWHPVREELSTVATTGDYNDLINAPQGGGGGSSDKKIYIQADMTAMMQNLPSELTDPTMNDKVGLLEMFGLNATNGTFQITTGIMKADTQSNKYLICFDNPYNVTGKCYLVFFVEVNGQFKAYSIATIDIQESQQTYVI